jgi:cell wall-associated NlpC family hydrolase
LKRFLPFLLALFVGIGLFIPTQESHAAYSPNNVIKIAKSYIGTPYRWGGVSPRGFDCSGFVYYSHKKAGITLPRSAAEMFKTGRSVSKSSLKPGDLIFFHTYNLGASHVAIYIGNGQFIDSEDGRGVSIDSFNNCYWKSRYLGARRI